MVFYNVNLKDNVIIAEGYFSATIFDEHGNKIDNDGNIIKKPFFEKKNTIVNDARKVMAHAIGDCSGTFGCINEFHIGGDNSVDANEMLNPVAPQITDTDIVYTSNRFIRENDDLDSFGNPLFVVSYPNAPNETSVLFTIKIEKTEANLLLPTATVYLCAGLFINTGTETILFASQSFPVMSKTPNREFLYSWTISF